MAEPFEHFDNTPSPFKSKRTGSIFSFIESPAGQVETGYYTGVTNNKLLIKHLQVANSSNSKSLKDFYYKDYESHKTKLVRTEYLQKTFDDWVPKSVTSVVPLDSEFSVKEGQYSRDINIESRLSRKNGNIDSNPRITASVDLSKRHATYKMYFIFQEGTEYAPYDEMIPLAIPGPPYDDSDGEGILAIEMTCQNYLDYRIILNHISPKFNPEAFFTYLFDKKHSKLSQTKKDREKLDNLYAQAPLFYIQSLSNDDLFLDLKELMLYDKSSWFDDSSESMIKIITGFSDFKFLYDKFYDNPKYTKTIYKLINADSGPNSKETYCDFLAILCLFYQPVKDPDELETVRIGGKYELDSDLYGGEEDKVKIWNYYTTIDYVIDAQSTYNAYYDSSPIKEDTIFHTRVRGYYHPMQLMILEDAETGQSVIVPAIFIKRLSDIAEWEKIINVLTTILTIVSMLTSVGILFRGATGLIRLFAIVDIGVGTIDLSLSNDDIRNALKNSGEAGAWFVENWPVLSFMSSMGILSIQMAKGIIKNAPKLIKKLKKTKKFSVSKELEKLYSEALKIQRRLNNISSGTGGSFKYLDEITTLKMFAQEEPMSCAAACIRQIAKDNGLKITEEAVRLAAKTDGIGFGTILENIGPALQKFFPKETILHGSAFIEGIDDMKEVARIISSTYNKPWIASLRPPGGNVHSVIVDKIVDGKVFIRDPWDKIKGFGGNNGVQATMNLDDFESFWKGSYNHFVILK